MGNEKKENPKKNFFPTGIFENNNKKEFPDIMESIMRENNISSSKKLTQEEKVKITVEFIEAIINKNYDLMVECFNKGADINYKIDLTPFTKNYYIQGATPIFYAIKDYDEKIFNFLVRNGADVNTEDENKVTPLMKIISIGETQGLNLELIEKIITKGANINAYDKNGKTAFIMQWNKKNYR